MFVRLLAIFCLFAGVLAIQEKIVGGFDADIADYPYQVSMRLFDKHHFCGGSILNENYILTAAHCIHGQTIDNMTIVVGSSLLDEGGDSYAVLQLIPHPTYSSTFLFHDIGLVKVKGPIIFGDKVKPVVLPESNVTPDMELILTGWGLTSFPANNTSTPNHLQYIELVAVNVLSCRFAHFVPAAITTRTVCAQGKTDQGACKGDSGGPLVNAEKKYQVGVVSWGNPCAKGKPDVYTNLFRYLSWVHDNMK